MWIPRAAAGVHPPDTDRLQRPQSSVAHVNLGPHAQTFIINDRGTQTSFDGGQSPDAALTPETEDVINQDINVSVNPANNNNIHDNADNESLSDDGTAQVTSI